MEGEGLLFLEKRRRSGIDVPTYYLQAFKGVCVVFNEAVVGKLLPVFQESGDGGGGGERGMRNGLLSKQKTWI